VSDVRLADPKLEHKTSEQLAEQKHQARAKRRYVRLRLGDSGPSCIVHPPEAEAMMRDDADLTASDVWMTQAEFEALPDFGGF
jgi:hypothetical protein